MNYVTVLFQNPATLTNNKRCNKKLVSPAIELGKHNVLVNSKGSDEGSYCSTKGSYFSHDYYLIVDPEKEDDKSSQDKSPASEIVVITNVNVTIT